MRHPRLPRHRGGHGERLLLQVFCQWAVDVAQALCHALCVGLRAEQRRVGVVMVIVLHGFLLAAALLVEEVGSDVVYVNELHARFLSHFAIPLAVAVVAPLYLAAGNESIYIPVPNDGFTRATVAISTTNACDDATLENVRVEEVPDAYVDYYLDCCTKRRAADSKITSYTSDSIVAQVDAPEAGYLFVPIPYSESWHVYVDGIEQDAFSADYAFIGFEIEGGKHQIELVYQDAAYNTGIALFAVSFAGLITVKIVVLRRSASRSRGATIRTGR